MSTAIANYFAATCIEGTILRIDRQRNHADGAVTIMAAFWLFE
jgi:hypothetical protein